MADISELRPPMPVEMIEICRTEDVPAEGGLKVDLSGREALAVFRAEEEYFVTADQCTHGGASLSEGTVEGIEVECPYHMGRFCLRTGEVTRPPCVEPLQTYAAEIREGRIFVQLSYIG